VAFNVIGQASAEHITGLFVKDVFLHSPPRSLDIKLWLSFGDGSEGATNTRGSLTITGGASCLGFLP
jgi:hypothetical protein